MSNNSSYIANMALNEYTIHMNIFDIIGPVMVGPSSSHTAGALKIASVAAHILGQTPVRAQIRLYGSFAQTYKGHGTDFR